MRIALVVERFLPSAGGVENAAWNVAHGLARAGDDVLVVARRAATCALPVRCVAVPSAWQPLRVAAFSRAAARAAPRGSVDCVVSFARTRHQDVYRAGGGSHADYLEGRHAAASARWRRLTPRHAVLLAHERGVFRDATQLVVCGSDLVRRQIRARYGLADARLPLLRNGVDLERFHPRCRSSRARLREQLGAGSDCVWLFAGSGFPRKGLDTALRALAAGGGGASLWVAGRDDPRPWRARARALGVGERVRFLGFRADLRDLYAAADALLLPTRYDAFANACLEAAAAGLPVVTSGADGASEVIGDGGAVVPDPEDAAGFARALEALRDPGERARRGEAARATAERFGWEAHVAGLRALLRGRPA